MTSRWPNHTQLNRREEHRSRLYHRVRFTIFEALVTFRLRQRCQLKRRFVDHYQTSSILSPGPNFRNSQSLLLRELSPGPEDLSCTHGCCCIQLLPFAAQLHGSAVPSLQQCRAFGGEPVRASSFGNTPNTGGMSHQTAAKCEASAMNMRIYNNK